jgi:hypothetical protein
MIHHKIIHQKDFGFFDLEILSKKFLLLNLKMRSDIDIC